MTSQLLTERQRDIVELVILGQVLRTPLELHFSESSGPRWCAATPHHIATQLGGVPFPSEAVLCSVHGELQELASLGVLERRYADEWNYIGGPISEFFEDMNVYSN